MTHFLEFVQTLLHCALCRICTRPARIVGPSTRRMSGKSTVLVEASSTVVRIIRSSWLPWKITGAGEHRCSDLRDYIPHNQTGGKFFFFVFTVYRYQTNLINSFKGLLRSHLVSNLKRFSKLNIVEKKTNEQRVLCLASYI